MTDEIQFEDLAERAPYDRDAYDSLSGGVVVHRCHPSEPVRDYYAFAFEHTDMKGYTEKAVWLHSGDAGSRERLPVGRWNSAVRWRHVREGSHVDCPVCNGEADETHLLDEVLECIPEKDLAKKGIYQRDDGPEAIVHIDSKGSYSSGGHYDVPNATQHWDAVVRGHPYVQITGAREVGEGGNVHSPDNTLRVSLEADYPDPGGECVL